MGQLSVAVAALALHAPLVAQTPGTASPTTLRAVLREHHVPVDSSPAQAMTDKAIGRYVVEDAPDMFAIAFEPRASSGESPDAQVEIGVWDRRTGRWSHATFPATSSGNTDWPIGSLLAIHHAGRHLLIDTHVNPSAGTIVVLSPDLAPVTTLPGWVLRVLPTGTVLYHRSAVHFAPAHPVELRTWDAATRRDVRLYGTANGDPVRERLDARLADTVVVADAGRSLSFVVTFSPAAGSPAATPPFDVAVKCQDVGTKRAWCSERPITGGSRGSYD
jgi:hypothetical protein